MFSIEVTTTNPAFDGQEATETARIIRKIAVQLENGTFEGTVFDINGNKVGRYLLDDDE